MAKTCNKCSTQKETNAEIVVPYIVHEAAQARQERNIKRLWVALIVSVAMIFISNMAWIGAWTSYDYSSTTEEIIVEQDAQDGGNNNYIGNDGDIINGLPENNNPQEATD